MLDATTITDEQIRELRESDPSARHAKRAAMYARALGRFGGATPEHVHAARARCAEILNARGAKEPR